MDASIEEMIVAEKEPKEDTVTPEVKAIDGQNEELDLEAYVLNSIMDLFYDDYDVSLTALFETDDLFYSKINAMKSNFTYLCDLLPNGYSVCDDHFMHMFDINSTQTSITSAFFTPFMYSAKILNLGITSPAIRIGSGVPLYEQPVPSLTKVSFNVFFLASTSSSSLS